MKKLLAIAVALSSSLLVSAQELSEAKSEIRKERLEFVREIRNAKSTEKTKKQAAETVDSVSAGVTDEEVGEAASFNKNAKFFGTASTGVVLISADCTPAGIGFELGPDDRCLTITDPAVTTVGTYNDIGRITMPARKADNVIYAIANHTASAILTNSTAANTSGLIGYTPTVTFESVALSDPAAIDPNTGLPMNGSYTTGGFGTRSITKTLAPGFFEVDTVSYTRANTSGFSRRFWEALGLPQSVINEIYRNPITIRLNITVRARRVQDGTFFFSTRFLAN